MLVQIITITALTHERHFTLVLLCLRPPVLALGYCLIVWHCFCYSPDLSSLKVFFFFLHGHAAEILRPWMYLSKFPRNTSYVFPMGFGSLWHRVLYTMSVWNFESKLWFLAVIYWMIVFDQAQLMWMRLFQGAEYSHVRCVMSDVRCHPMPPPLLLSLFLPCMQINCGAFLFLSCFSSVFEGEVGVFRSVKKGWSLC